MDETVLEDAHLKSPSMAGIEEIDSIVSMSLNGADVTIDPDILTKRSTLIIDPPGMGYAGASGRSEGRPDHFDLKTDGKSCFLIHRQTGTQHELARVRCFAAS